MKDIKKTYSIDFLGVSIHVALVNNVEAYRNHYMVNTWGIPKMDSSASAIHTSFYTIHHGVHWLTFPLQVTPGIIVHEVLHMAEYIDDYFEIKSKEFRAYIVEHFTDLIYKEANLNKRPVKES